MEKIIEEMVSGRDVTREEALALLDMDLELLLKGAKEVKDTYTTNSFDLCSIINGKSGRCSEDCTYCGQSKHYHGKVENYPLLEREKILKEALYNEKKGVGRYSVVTSGKALTKEELEEMVDTYRFLDEKCQISLCASHGLLEEEELQRLKEAGVTRYHNNLETSRNYFPKVCTTHTYDDKIKTIKAAQRVGLHVCSGGIIGLGENWEDRIDLAITLRDLGIKSIPLNVLMAIDGTPLEGKVSLSFEEILRAGAIFRLINPRSIIRMAGGRILCEDQGKRMFQYVSNGAITGDLLTTAGLSIDSDIKLLESLGYTISRIEEQ